MTGSAPWSGVTLDRIVESLGAPAVDVLVAGSRPVSGPRIWDPGNPHAVEPGEILLGVNVTDVDALLQDATAAQAAAVAVKGRVPPAALAAATSADVAVLRVAADVPWDAVYRVVQTIGAAASDADDAEAPVRDLFSLANAIAALVGGAVTIEDPRSTLLAYSNLDQPIDDARQATILGRTHGHGWSDRLAELGILHPLVANPGSVRSVIDPTGEARPRLAASVGAGNELLAFVWAVEGDRSFTDADVQALRGSLPLVALHVLRHRASGDLTRRQRGAALRQALQSAQVSDSLASELGIAPDAPCAVAAFHLLGDDPVELAAKRARAVDLITTAAEAFRRRVVCAWIEDTVYALFPDVDDTSIGRLVSLTAGIARQAQAALPADVVAGIGSSVGRLVDIGRSRAEADRTVRVLRDEPETRFAAHIDQVRTPATLLALRDLLHGRPELHLPDFDALARVDAESGTQHMATLRAFALSGGSVSATGAALSLHPNTVRYRIARIQELVQLDLSSPAALFLVSLHMHIT